MRYQVRWVGSTSLTWEPLGHLEHCQDLVADFHHLYPRKPRPHNWSPPTAWRPLEDRGGDELLMDSTRLYAPDYCEGEGPFEGGDGVAVGARSTAEEARGESVT